MTPEEFSSARKLLGKTQKQMAEILGTSIKAVHSYDQGWRTIPPYVERQVFLLVSRMHKNSGKAPCWKQTKCPNEHKKACPAWEYHSGDECWFINGTFCKGNVQKSWADKMAICRSCKVMTPLLRLLSFQA